MARTQDLWSNIPTELAGIILGCLHAHVDRVRFAAVCPQWRSAARQVKLPPPLPLLVLKDRDVFYSMPRGERLHFAGRKDGYISTVCGNWLVYRCWLNLLLVDPFSGSTMTLPAPSTVRLPEEEVGEDSEGSHDSADEGEDSEGSHDSADEVEDSEGSHDSADEGDDFEDGSISTDRSKMLSMDMKHFKVIKLIVCSANLIAALLKGTENNRIAVCQPGGSKWSIASGFCLWMRISDMAFYQGKLYVVEHHERLLALDISVDDKTGDPRVSWIGRVINDNQFDTDWPLKRMLYLVESYDSLLLVRRRIFYKHVLGEGQIHTFAGQCEPDVSIFKADFGQSQWREVTTLADNLALFLGPCSRAVCMPQGDSPGNRVWFLDDYKEFHWREYFSMLTSDTCSVANTKPFSPLPMISWNCYRGNAGAAWLFPAN